MSVMVFNPDKLTITPTPQKTKSFGANSGLHAISQMINAWLEENPTVRIIQMMPNGKPCYEKYLTENGFKYHGISNKKGTRRPTVESFAKEHKSGTHFVRVSNHVVAIVDGIYYDTWDSGFKSLYGYWVKEV